MKTQKLDVVYTLYCLSVYEERSMFCLAGPPAIHNDFLSLAAVQDKVVV